MNDFNTVKELAMWIIELIGKNKSVVLSDDGADWDWVASEVWRSYPAIVNEFLINDAIDFLLEAAEIDE